MLRSKRISRDKGRKQLAASDYDAKVISQIVCQHTLWRTCDCLADCLVINPHAENSCLRVVPGWHRSQLSIEPPPELFQVVLTPEVIGALGSSRSVFQIVCEVQPPNLSQLCLIPFANAGLGFRSHAESVFELHCGNM